MHSMLYIISTALFEINNEIIGGFLYKRLKINSFFLRMLTSCILQSQLPDKDTVSLNNDDMRHLCYSINLYPAPE